MAAGLSRRYISGLGLQQGPSITLAGPSRQIGFAVRGYAAAAAKQKPTGKAATKPAAGAKGASPSKATPTLKAAPTPKPKSAPAKAPALKAKATSAPKPPSKVSPTELRRTGSGVAYKVPERSDEPLTDEEQMAQLEQVMNLSKNYPTADPWGQRVETLDVMLPNSTSLSDRSNYPSWRAMYDQFKQNRLNSAKNFISMLMLAQENAVPGLDLSEHRWWHKMFTVWPRRLMSTTSLKDNSWTRQLRLSALDSYCQLNTAFAKRDDAAIKSFTTDVYQEHMIRQRKKQKPGHKYIWTLHREVTPPRVISLRATQGYLATEEPKFGNRMMVHALVRLDTEQSLEIYTDTGVPLHVQNWDGKTTGKRMPAKPTRVTEYFVFEKRMWYDGPWLLREQLWEKPGQKPAI